MAGWEQRGQLGLSALEREPFQLFTEPPGNLVGSAVGCICPASSVTSAGVLQQHLPQQHSSCASKSCSRGAGESANVYVEEKNILAC